MKKIFFLFLLLPFYTNGQIITTIAGIDSLGYYGDGGPATAALLSEPICVRTDHAGNVYIADYTGHRIRKINTSGIITTIAGIGTSGLTGDGGPATAAAVFHPQGVAIDTAGNIYIAESGTGRVRKINTSGTITTIAGGGTSTADGVPATTAILSAYDVAADRAGNIYIGDYGRIRQVNTSGIISTVAGTGTLGHTGDGGPATAAELVGPIAITLDPSGNLLFVDNNYIRKINTSTGIISTIAGGISPGYAGDGGPATAALFVSPSGIGTDAAGNVYIGDRGNNVVRKINTTGIITTVAGNEPAGSGFSGDGGPATAAQLAQPMGISIDQFGNLYIADAANSNVRKVSGVGATQVYNYALTVHWYKVFPNPANSELNIASKEKIKDVVIRNLAGQEVLKHTYDSEIVQIDISLLPPGAYFVQINSADAVKFVKE